jgi:hypothetical protein
VKGFREDDKPSRVADEGVADHEMTTSRRVTSIEDHRRRRRVEALLPEMALEFQSTGVVLRHLDDPTDVDVWREAGRLVGRRLGRHVRTGVTPCGCAALTGAHVWVLDLDREATAADRAQAIQLVSTLVDGGEPPG